MDENAYANFLRTFRFITDYSERDWLDDAACKGMDTSIFFPEKPSARDLKRIEGICNSCPVKDKCRDYGEMETYGFWGGVGHRRRVKERVANKVPSTVDG